MKSKTIYFCSECGNETVKWYGKCPACGSYNTMVEQTVSSGNSHAENARKIANLPERLQEIQTETEIRFSTGLSELDRVLGGGAVKGSLVLVGGSPGIGKSTLLLQICSNLGRTCKILYVTGEESKFQLKMRAERLQVFSENLYILAETSLNTVLDTAASVQPDVLIVDSIQTLLQEDLSSAPGSIGQVKECTMALMRLAKTKGTTVFVIGHVNKEGAIAGPKVLEHMVDCVLYFEGAGSASYRILRAAKNRFGSTNEIGMFEMLDTGLHEVLNPSEMLLSGRPQATPGTCVTCVMEGTRPILSEIQALVSPSSYTASRRNSNGIDYNRAMLLLAVLEKRGGLRLSSADVYINVIGGLNLDEPAADLATILAIASSYTDKAMPDDMVAIGEVGLTGEIRNVYQMQQRLAEISRLGFKKCIIPKQRSNKMVIPDGLDVSAVKTVQEALKLLF